MRSLQTASHAQGKLTTFVDRQTSAWTTSARIVMYCVIPPSTSRTSVQRDRCGSVGLKSTVTDMDRPYSSIPLLGVTDIVLPQDSPVSAEMRLSL